MRMKCEMIQDLIPVYYDGIASETTNHEMQHHFKQCSDCRQAYHDYCRSMRIDVEDRTRLSEDSVSDAFAAISRRIRRRKILSTASVSTIAVVAAVVAFIGICREMQRSSNE